ncbi:hypothetical protein [Streptomyces sp. NPDC014623]|uniref:hypothetical protein n=1 Tax=Streptomyces sp. NPDC014623 TaxID=3364875 RepID=UPI0036F768A2
MLGKVFDRSFADNIEATAGIGRLYFDSHKNIGSTLGRSARRAAWRATRREENVDE